MRPGKDGVALPAINRGPDEGGAAVYTVEEPGGRRTRVVCLDGTGRFRSADADVAARFWAERTGGSGPTSATLCSRVTHLALKGRLVWDGDRPADISGQRDAHGWRRVSVRLDEPATVRFPVPDAAVVDVDGKETKAERDSATHTASLSLDAGTHILRVR
jgi:hypothetical protein